MVTDKEAHHPALMGAPPKSAIGNLVDLKADEILLPGFLARRPDGVYLDPQQLDSPEQLRQFIDRVFGSGAVLAGLDFDTLSTLLYPTAPTGAPPGPRSGVIVRIAEDIRPFPPERRNLYRNVKLTDGGSKVEYVFEPVTIDTTVEAPLYGEDENGNPVVTGYETRTVATPAILDVDEFIASLWQKGVRAGIDIGQVRAAIASGKTERLTIARRIEPEDGTDATLKEQTDALHRDDSPRILPNGKIDLNQFKNRFPQVTEGTRLLKKVPRGFGKLGFEPSGAPLEPAPPKDFNIEDLAGAGTRVEKTEQGEFIVAAQDGFLNIDTQSHVISVTEKIINRTGVSLRTTGNLSLAGDEFEEHGEVQERRVVEGKHMTFHADVFGSIHSSGGRVHLMANLAGGTVRSPGGSIQADKRVTQAVLEARDGEVAIGQAEGATIIAGSVRIEKAVACDIVAEDVHIDEAVGCAIVARRIHLARAGDRKGVETLVSIWMPDYGDLDKRIEETRQSIAELETRAAARQAQVDERMGTVEMQKYLAIGERIRSGALKLNAAQETQWQQAVQRQAKPLQEVRALKADIDGIQASLAAEQGALADLLAQREAAGGDLHCLIDAIAGDVSVRALAGPPGAPVMAGIAPKDMKLKLRDSQDTRKRLFHGDRGEFGWQGGAQEAGG